MFAKRERGRLRGITRQRNGGRNETGTKIIPRRDYFRYTNKMSQEPKRAKMHLTLNREKGR